MNASFEEKSAWVQLLGLSLTFGGYFVVAATMLAEGVTTLAAYVPLFIIAVVLLVAVLVAGHIAISILSRPDGRDERDRLIAWRAESQSSWILGLGVLAAITALIVAIEPVWVAHLLLASLFLSEFGKYLLQINYYRRGV